MSELLLSKALASWAASRSDEVVFNPKQGFYSFDIVADAYEKGITVGKDSFKEELRKKYFDKANIAGEAMNVILSQIFEKKYRVYKVFLNHTIEATTILMVIDEVTHNDDVFIDFAYKKIGEMQSKFHSMGLNLDISFVDNNSGLNIKLIKADGFGFAYDIIEGKEIL
jgi:hypothetical protein